MARVDESGHVERFINLLTEIAAVLFQLVPQPGVLLVQQHVLDRKADLRAEAVQKISDVRSKDLLSRQRCCGNGEDVVCAAKEGEDDGNRRLGAARFLQGDKAVEGERKLIGGEDRQVAACHDPVQECVPERDRFDALHGARGCHRHAAGEHPGRSIIQAYADGGDRKHLTEMIGDRPEERRRLGFRYQRVGNCQEPLMILLGNAHCSRITPG